MHSSFYPIDKLLKNETFGEILKGKTRILIVTVEEVDDHPNSMYRYGTRRVTVHASSFAPESILAHGMSLAGLQGGSRDDHEKAEQCFMRSVEYLNTSDIDIVFVYAGTWAFLQSVEYAERIAQERKDLHVWIVANDVESDSIRYNILDSALEAGIKGIITTKRSGDSELERLMRQMESL